jgi:hypothetical protein
MSLPDANAITGALGRVLAALVRKVEPKKRLEVRVWERGIVAEVPYSAPCRLIDLDGAEIRDGVYIVQFLIWNWGTKAILSEDTPPSDQLKIEFAAGARVLEAYVLGPLDVPVVGARKNSDSVVDITHQGINPNDYAIIGVYVTGTNPLAEVKVHGRVLGQDYPIDRTELERRASWFERLAWSIILLSFTFSIPVLALTAFLIVRNYGWPALWDGTKGNSMPLYLAYGWSMMISGLTAFGLLRRWVRRKIQPEGLPLMDDTEPPLLESIQATLKMIFTGRRLRVSASIFSKGQRFMPSGKLTPRRTVDDWIRR